MMDGRWTRFSLGLFIGLLFLGKCDRMNKWPVRQFWEISWCVKIIRTGKWADCKLLAQQVRTALQSQVASFIGFLGLVCWWVSCIWICSFLALINHLIRFWRLHIEHWSEVAQSYPTLCDPMDCSLPGSSVHGIFQARVLEWVAISFSRASSQPRDWNRVSHIIGRLFTVWATREARF